MRAYRRDVYVPGCRLACPQSLFAFSCRFARPILYRIEARIPLPPSQFEASVMCDSDSVAEFVCRKVNEQSNSLYPLTVGPIESCEQNSEGACVITLVLHNESLNMKVKAEVTGEGQNMSLKDWKIISQG